MPTDPTSPDDPVVSVSRAGPARPIRPIRPTRNTRLPTRWTPTFAGLTAALVVLGLLWRTVRYALGFPIWGDESFVAVNFIVRDYHQMIEPLVYGQIVPLMFMWADLAISRVLGYSEWALRLLPFASGVLSLLLFWWFCRRVLPQRAVLLAVGILASSYYAVRHAAEVKPYATDLLCALVLLVLAWAVLERPRSLGRWFGLISAAALAVWCSYPGAFVAGGIGLVLTWRLIVDRFPTGLLLGWVLYGLAVVGSFGWMYTIYAGPHARAAARLTQIEMWTQAFPPLDQPARLPLWLVGIHTGRMFAFPQGGPPPKSAATLILVVIGTIALWKRNRTLTLLLLSALPLAFVAACFKAYPYGGSARTMLYFAPAVCLLAGFGWYRVLHYFFKGEVLRGSLIISAVALGVFPIVGIIRDLREPYRSDAVLASYRAVREVADASAPTDQWVIFNSPDKVPWAPWLGDWSGVGGQFVFDALRFAPQPPIWSPPPSNVTAPPSGRVWLLVYYADNQPKGVVFPDALLSDYLASLERRLGAYEHRRYEIKIDEQAEKHEALDVYQFGSKHEN